MDSTYPIPPTQALPKLAHLARTSSLEIKTALDNLKELYFSTERPSSTAIAFDELSCGASEVLHKSSTVVEVQLHEKIAPVPDSGYASAEDDTDEECLFCAGSNQENGLSILRSDPFERAYALKGLTGFVGRSDVWLSCSSTDEEGDEEDEPGLRVLILEEASRLINAFSEEAWSSPLPENEDGSDGSILRSFSFPTLTFTSPTEISTTEVIVQLNDAPLSSSDHTSVGLQSWGSSIILAERLCSNPMAFSILPKQATLMLSTSRETNPLFVLELGAGTGLLSIVTCKIAQHHSSQTTIVATDYHPDVLINLTSNVKANLPARPGKGASPSVISVCRFDWEFPDYGVPLFDEPFGVILAADVVYHPSHAAWIKSCVERMLLRPEAERREGGVFWLIIPLRTTGRHEGMHYTVENLFPLATRGQDQLDGEGKYELAILELEEGAKRDGIGRADENGYRLYKIG